MSHNPPQPSSATAPSGAKKRINVHYRVVGDAATIEARARAIAVEQSVEMPVAAIDAADVLDDIVGQVGAIADRGDGSFDVHIGLALETTGLRAGQLLNMLFGNSSLQTDVTLMDADFPDELVQVLGGPNVGLAGLRARVGAVGRALTCSALKPQGLPAADLARLAAQMAEGGLDFIKDDHGLADQAYSPFAERVPAIAEAVAKVVAHTGVTTSYLPSLNGTLDDLRQQVALARDSGLEGALIAPMIVGVDSFVAVRQENPDFAFMTHPAFAGVARIAPAFQFGKLFRLLGADAVVFPNFGGRFGYTPEECLELAQNAVAGDAVRSAVPVPAGGMTLERVPEMLDFYGPDVMVLI
ncbi:MAG: RuBisCO large subunit C-terminal-like domain-containing protein, partial [Rhizomicrobium sp.]